MSLPTQPIDVRIATDPRIARGPMAAVMTRGPTSTLFKTVRAVGETSLTPTFNWLNSNKACGISRRIVLRAKGSITVVDTAAAVASSTIDNALRAYPLQSNMNSCVLTLDSVPLSIQNPSVAVPLLALVGNPAESMGLEQSIADCRPDNFSDYGDAGEAVAGDSSIFGLNQGPYTTASIRGRKTGIESYACTAGASYTLGFDIAEPLLISPCASADNADSKYFFGIQQFGLSVAYIANATGMLCAKNTCVPTGAVTLTFTEQWIEYEECMVDDLMLLAPSRPWSYHVATTNVYTTSLKAIAHRASLAGAQSAVLNVTTVPSRLLIAAVFGGADVTTPTTAAIRPNVCFQLSNVNITVGGRASLFAAASRTQLYEVSRRAGVRLPFPVWAGKDVFPSLGTAATAAKSSYAGGPLVIPFEYLSLPEGVLPGMQQQLQIQVTCTVTNQCIALDAASPTLVVIAITDGILTALDGATAIMTGIPRAAVDAATKTSSSADVSLVAASSQTGGYQGGAWYDSLAKGFMMPIDAVAKIAPLATAIAAPGLMPAAAALQKLTGNGAVLGGADLGGVAVRGGRAKKGGAALRLA